VEDRLGEGVVEAEGYGVGSAVLVPVGEVAFCFIDGFEFVEG